MSNGMVFKTKSQMNNYFNKNKYKQKNFHNSTTNNTLISEKEASRIVVDTFLKGTSKECASGVGFAKYKTSKNSPEHFSSKMDKGKDTRSLSGKQSDNNQTDKAYQIKSNLSTAKINTMFKESVGFENMLKRKIQMIHNKHFKSNNSQLTYSNIYNNNNSTGKIKLENSLYQKGNKNASFIGKKGNVNVNVIDDDLVIQNINKKVISPKIEQKSIDKNNNNNNNHDHQDTSNETYNNKDKCLKSNNSKRMNLNNKISQHLTKKNMNNIMNQNKTKSQRPISSSTAIYSSSSSSSNNNIDNSSSIYKNNILNSKGYNIMKQFDKIHVISSPHIICEYQKMSKTAFQTKNNSRKNSIDKKKDVQNNNFINYNHKGYPSSSALKINKYNDAFKSKHSYSKRTISSNKKNKQIDHSLGKCNKNVDDSNKNVNVNFIESDHNMAFVNALHINPITPDSTCSGIKKSSVIQNMNNKGITEANVNNLLNNNNANLIKGNCCNTPNNISNMSDINFLKYIASNIKSSITNKNGSVMITNKLIKKKEESEKDLFIAKMKGINSDNKSLTTVHSKQNSKSNSRLVDDILEIGSSSKININNNNNNDALFNLQNAGNKSDKAVNLNMQIILNNKKDTIPIGLCQSPLVKSTQEILKKIHLNNNNNNNKSPENKNDINKELKQRERDKEKDNDKKSSFKMIANCFKKTPESIENSASIPKIKDQRLNETNESIQSTARESSYYKKEMERIAAYIKQYYYINNSYLPSKVDFYKFGRVIGRGAFGKVNLALHTCSGRLVAIKSFCKSKQTSKHSKNKIKNEIDVLKQLQHPFISQILDTFETETHIVIVMEYICGDLLSYIRKRSKLSEAFAKIIFKQLIEGLKFIHQNNIVHRDIKLDNILFDLNNTVKICDFGVSRKLKKGDVMNEHCGTPAYIAPEIFQNKGYEGFACDIWSAGVTLYYIISGTQPFKANNLSKLQATIIQGKFDKIDTASQELKDLLDRMLQVDPKKRITINQILAHPWLNGVSLKNKNNFPLFTTAELVLLAKYNVNYLTSNKEDMIENFTMQNLLTEKEEEHMNGNTKSYILAPYNSNASLNDSLFSSEVMIDNEICKFCRKVKQINVKYELNNNKEFDNGMIITKQESLLEEKEKDNYYNNNGLITSSSGIYSSKPLSPQIERDFDYNNNQRDIGGLNNKGDTNEDDEVNKCQAINEGLLNDIEIVLGYKKTYLLECLMKKEVNYGTAAYFLLNYEAQKDK